MTPTENAPFSDDAPETAAAPTAVEEEVERLRAENAVLLARVAELERRLGLNSSNSSKLETAVQRRTGQAPTRTADPEPARSVGQAVRRAEGP